MDNTDRQYFRRRSVRLEGYDYKQAGLYFVTICTHRQQLLFGDVHCGRMYLNDLGQLVHDYWRGIATVRDNIELDFYVVMPNHLHGILCFVGNKSDQRHTEQLGTTLSDSNSLVSGSLGAVIGQFKSMVTKRSRSLSSPPCLPILQRNYYERIIRSERALNEIRGYIMGNPARWHEDDLFAK